MAKTILMALLIIGLVGTLAGGGLFAYFSDSETSEGNTFQAGTIVLDVDWDQDPNAPDTIGSPSVVEAKPCMWKRFELDKVINNGENDGLLSFRFNNLVWEGGANPDAENEAGDTDNSCDIEDYLDLIVLYSNANPNVLPILDGTYYDPDLPPAADYYEGWQRLVDAGYDAVEIYSGPFKNFSAYKDGSGHGWISLSELKSGQYKYLQLYVHLQSRGSGTIDNIMQGDQVTLDKQFILEQFPCDYEPPHGDKSHNLPVYPVYAHIQYSPSYPSTSLNCYWTVWFNWPATYQHYAGHPVDYPEGQPIPESEKTAYHVQDYGATGIKYYGWCIDERHTLPYTSDHLVTMASSLNESIYGYNPGWHVAKDWKLVWGWNPPVEYVFNYVNYLINNYSQTVKGEGPLQQAIWCFINNHTPDNVGAAAQAMVNDALANGSDFGPDAGQDGMVVLFTPEYHQLVGIEVDP